MRVTVYGSSSGRTSAAYLRAAERLGARCAQRGWTVVNGAGRDGCMGALTDGVLAAGGRVHGVILRQFAEAGLQHPGLVDCQVADDMRTRKRLLAEGADAFIALPGGPGTWEELWEIAVQRQIGAITAPLIVVDVAGCYAPLRAQLERAASDGLLYGPPGDLLTFAGNADEAVSILAGESP
jgi:uncharacterized protein (TIGR00730 family)